jgi:hypothetical protein
MGFTLQFTTFRAGVWLVFDFMEIPGVEVLIFSIDRSLEKLLHKLVEHGLIELLGGHTWLKFLEFVEARPIFGSIFIWSGRHIQWNLYF